MAPDPQHTALICALAALLILLGYMTLLMWLAVGGA